MPGVKLPNSFSDGVFNTDPPALGESEIKRLLLKRFGLGDVQLRPLVSERDQNFLVNTEAGSRVLKISNIAEDPLVVQAQTAALNHLLRSGLHRCVPSVIKDLDGEQLLFYSSAQGTHCIRLLSYLPGHLYSADKKTPDSLTEMGEFVGRLSRSLCSFGHKGAHRGDFLWNLDNALDCETHLGHVENPDNRMMLAKLFERYRRLIQPQLVHCRAAVIHNDVNDNNIVVLSGSSDEAFGLIDFGDLCFARQINELAITLAYVLQGEEDLYTASRQMVSAYHQQFSLNENELDVLFDLVRMRLVMSVCISSKRAKSFAGNDYLRISQKPAFELLWRMQEIDPAFMNALLRKAAGYEPIRHHQPIISYLSSEELTPAAMFDFDLQSSCRRVLKLDNVAADGRVETFAELITAADKERGVKYLIGLYGEDRNVYRADQFQNTVTPERRTIHLGLDIFIHADTALYAPLPGRVFSLVDNNQPLDYGPTLILEHRVPDSGVSFYTLYGHLSHSVFDLLSEGQPVDAGDLIGHVGGFANNGGWAPHLHFQLMTTMLEQHGNFNGVGEKSLWPLWQQICPDPNLLMQLAPESFECVTGISGLLEKRKRLLGPSLSTSYRNKLNIVRGCDAYLYDETGRQYLDCVNNICHVGHCHPHVVDALESQARILNTNTRYLHRTILDYSQRLSDLFPAPLSVVYFVNSGTEANELALRIARTATGVKETIVLDWGYHGNSGSMVDISPYKFKRKGGFAQPDFVEIAQFPDPYGGIYKGMTQQTGRAYAESVSACVESIWQRTGHGPAAFIAESISGVGGQVVYPDGYLQAAYQAVRARGGICIADEVQCGFGRVGRHFWAFELQGVIPDIVVLGKPMGNGHPMGAVVTTPGLAKQFANGMEYFNSFGGNPVSMAVGMAVLDVIEDQGLMHHADETGKYLLNKFNELKSKYHKIGDVRGHGFFLGLELVSNPETRNPDPELAAEIVNDLRENAVLFSTDGPHENVLKFKPPMVFSMSDADFLIDRLEAALSRH